PGGDPAGNGALRGRRERPGAARDHRGRGGRPAGRRRGQAVMLPPRSRGGRGGVLPPPDWWGGGVGAPAPGPGGGGRGAPPPQPAGAGRDAARPEPRHASRSAARPARVPLVRARRPGRTRGRIGTMLRWLTAGESHGRALVAICEGLPAGIEVTTADIAAALARRRAGYGRGARVKFEQDQVEITGGGRHGRDLA